MKTILWKLEHVDITVNRQGPFSLGNADKMTLYSDDDGDDDEEDDGHNKRNFIIAPNPRHKLQYYLNLVIRNTQNIWFLECSICNIKCIILINLIKCLEAF